MDTNILNNFGDSAMSFFDNAEVVTGGKQITTPGSYKAVVGSQKFDFKQKDGTTKTVVSPVLEYSKEAKNLMLQVNLVTTEDTPNVPAGSYIILNLLLAPSQATIQNPKLMNGFKQAVSITKQRLVLLIGKEAMDGVNMTSNWILENLLSTFDKDDKVVKSHKMINEVVIVVESGIYNNKPTVNLKRMYAVPRGFQSFEEQIQQTSDNGAPSIDDLANSIMGGSDSVIPPPHGDPDERYEV